MMDVLNQARGVLRDIIVPNGRSLIARSREKSRFLHEQKVEWDRLTKEARLRGDDLSARVQQDEEATARVRKEWDELLQKDAEACQRAVDLLEELEWEWDLKLEAEERSAALQQKANLDAEVVARLRREQDELRQTAERLRLERGTAREERDKAVRERDEVRHGVSSLQADVGATVALRLEVESISVGLGTELAEVWGILQAESDEQDLLRVAIEVVFDDLGVARPEEIGSLTAHAVDIMARVRQLEKNPFHSRITQAFDVARSHYDQEVNLEAMSLGFAPGYENSELNEIEKAVTPIAWNLANRLKDSSPSEEVVSRISLINIYL
ncbi:uncharacterized protein [Miscanthus floridulus]|uniref:uncharacterized protein n=1 Tax=Miscanthus floridulus TaxID=154761 RepID=UPI003459EAD5